MYFDGVALCAQVAADRGVVAKRPRHLAHTAAQSFWTLAQAWHHLVASLSVKIAVVLQAARGTAGA
jgi:hypothetical protein